MNVDGTFDAVIVCAGHNGLVCANYPSDSVLQGASGIAIWPLPAFCYSPALLGIQASLPG